MFEAKLSDDHRYPDFASGTGKTATAAITAVGRNSKKSGLPMTDNGLPQINATCLVRVYENGSLIFTASDYGVYAALQKAHAMNRKSYACGGR